MFFSVKHLNDNWLRVFVYALIGVVAAIFVFSLGVMFGKFSAYAHLVRGYGYARSEQRWTCPMADRLQQAAPAQQQGYGYYGQGMMQQGQGLGGGMWR